MLLIIVKSAFSKSLLRNLLFLLIIIFSGKLSAQNNPPPINWQSIFGGSNLEEAHAILQTEDSGYIVAGSNSSNDGDVDGNHGSGDQWVVKLNSTGGLEWQKSIGGQDDDWAHSVQPTIDGNFILAGYSKSDGGDATQNYGARDYWIVKIDASGNILWQKSFGGSGKDNAHCIQPTNDGGFIVSGVTESNDFDVSGNHGAKDCWILKLDASGNIVWKKCYGGSLDEDANSITQTAGDGFIFTGFTYSTDGDVSGYHGSMDCWVVKLDASGNIVWQKCLGGSLDDNGYAISQSEEGGYILAGHSFSSDGDLSGNYGGADFWVVKLDESGNITWKKSLGGTLDDIALAIKQVNDGNFIVTGYTASNDMDVSGNHGGNDAWIVSLDLSGNINWQKCAGGMLDDNAYSVQETVDGQLILAGGTFSNDGDFSANHGTSDFWVFQLENSTGVNEAPGSASLIFTYPNPVNESLTITTAITHQELLRINLVDIYGRITYSEQVSVSPGTYSKKLDVSYLPSGAYNLALIHEGQNSGNDITDIRKLVIVR